jgi:hypothetical protein
MKRVQTLLLSRALEDRGERTKATGSMQSSTVIYEYHRSVVFRMLYYMYSPSSSSTDAIASLSATFRAVAVAGTHSRHPLPKQIMSYLVFSVLKSPRAHVFVETLPVHR